ncbi:zinc finger Ran-binding domain-containing protein 2 isoform X1 [Salarias fasciatus]|uniref:zinc finger Ran-binding domain-containing protein 2 isoform X1 n=1 Tax=Salarias fasciatus TaxID=181472 RepID=UPI0011766BB5|nr:zinc finger Ran-binding domain-containing protein 2 isoform X1 [Salarias fasciatus]
MSGKSFRVSDGDWICPDKKCGNVNFARRTSCNRCGREKTTEAKMMKAGGTEIGKTLAEKSRGLFSANDWQCKTCGNVNWARRSECNMCNTPKYAKLEERTGYGGGFNERENVEYIEREESDGEYDEFGRKKKKYRGKNSTPSSKSEKKEVAKDDDEDEEDDDEDGDLSKYKLDDDDDDDDDDGDLSKYDLDASDEDKAAKKRGSRSGPALEAPPVPDLDLVRGLTPDPAPGLERAPLPGRGPTHPPPHLRGVRSTVAPGRHLEGENGGVLDHARPKGAAASRLDPPILAPVQKRNNLQPFIRHNELKSKRMLCCKENKSHPLHYAVHFHLISEVLHPSIMTEATASILLPFLTPSLFKTTHPLICDQCL